MTRQSWKSNLDEGQLYISYNDPVITPFRDNVNIEIEDIMYYYYDIQIIEHGKVIFEHRNSDSLNVIYLPECINSIINDDMKNSYTMYMEDSEFGYEHLKYKSIKINGAFDQDYSVRLERYDWVIVSDIQTFSNSNYTLNIGKHERNRKYGGMRENYGQYTIIERLSKGDLIRLKNTCDRFNQLAVKDYNDNYGKDEYIE